MCFGWKYIFEVRNGSIVVGPVRFSVLKHRSRTANTKFTVFHLGCADPFEWRCPHLIPLGIVDTRGSDPYLCFLLILSWSKKIQKTLFLFKRSDAGRAEEPWPPPFVGIRLPSHQTSCFDRNFKNYYYFRFFCCGKNDECGGRSTQVFPDDFATHKKQPEEFSSVGVAMNIYFKKSVSRLTKRTMSRPRFRTSNWHFRVCLQYISQNFFFLQKPLFYTKTFFRITSQRDLKRGKMSGNVRYEMWPLRKKNMDRTGAENVTNNNW